MENSLYEISTKLNLAPCSLASEVIILRLLEEHGTVGDEMGKMVWLNNTVDVLDRIIGVVRYIVDDSTHFDYETTEDWGDVLRGIEWIRMNLGFLLS